MPVTLRRLFPALAAAVLVALPLGGGALGATSFGNNGDIVFVRGADILLRSGTGLVTVLVTGGLAPATDPSFSPDGTKLAYVQSTLIKTCTVSSCSGTPVPGLVGSQPVWSPDGTKFAYVTPANQIQIASSSDGSGIVAVTATGTNADPSWSPDGTQLVFTRNGAIVKSGVGAGDGESATAIATTGVSSSRQPAWSPDGTTIAFDSSSSGVSHVYVVSAAGGSATQVTPTSTEAETAPSWSPDGTKIVYANASQGIVSVAQAGGGGWQTPERLTTTITDATPDWQTVVPTNNSLPTITGGGAPQTGQLLSATTGSWSGARSFSYEWRRCDSSGNGCSAIGGATSASYAVVSADVGNTLRVAVTASNAAGPSAAPAVSNPTGVVTQAGVVNPPKNTSYPVISFGFGQTAPLVGATITATNGTWTGSFPMTFSYQWKRCASATAPCYNIPNAKSSFYTVPEAYYGMVLRVEVTATNSAGAVSQNSEATPAVTAIAPVLRSTPQIIDSTPVVDSPLSLTNGTWEGTPFPKFTYSWRRCNPPGDVSSCVPIAGATASTYTPKEADIGTTIRVWISGTNPAGSALAITNHTFPVIDKEHFAPTTVTAPAIVGAVGIGRQLTASAGSFDGDAPLTSVLAWQRCDATGEGCKTIAGATKITYFPTRADVGFTLRLTVTVTNDYGKLLARSDPTEPVPAARPRRKGRRIVGTARADYLAGSGFDDTILGLGGNDALLGGAGDDRIEGGAGNDVITGGAGADTLLGGAGSDTIYAADGERDVVDCGDGRDRAVVDSVDKVAKSCEMVQIAGAPATAPPAGETPTP